MEKEPSPRPPKREISPWVWIGASCGVLVLGIGGLVVGGGYFVTRQMREANERVREQIRDTTPLLLAAEMKARRNADLRVVSRDPKNRTITFRHARTGERIVLGQTGEEQLRVQVDEGEAILHFVGSGGMLNALWRNDADFLLGTGAGAAIPSWVPRYPDAKLHPIYAFAAPDGRGDSGSFITSSRVRFGPVIAFYNERLERLGFRAREEAGAVVSTAHPDGRLFFAYFSSQPAAGETRLLVTYAEPLQGRGPGNR